MMRDVFILSVVVVLCATAVSAHAAPSDRFWDPFRGTSQLRLIDTARTLLERFTDTVRRVAGNPVSFFRSPDPSFLGVRPTSAYRPDFLGQKFSLGLRPSPPAPVRDVSGAGTPCGGSDSDPYWANDCSCRCSRGGRDELTYEVSDRCPEDSNLACEDCRKITRHDKHVQTVQECLEPFNADPFER